MRPFNVIVLAWIAFALFWLVSSFRVNRTAVGEGRAGIARRLFLGLVAWLLLFRSREARLGVLDLRFVPNDLWIVWLGAILTVLGVAFATWARVHIGRYWSANVVLKEEHKLIRSGPYARIRHPIYTGLLAAVVGSALSYGRVAGLLAVAIYTISFWLKARKEEALLAGKFGPAFDEHRRHTGFFLPRLALPS